MRTDFQVRELGLHDLPALLGAYALLLLVALAGVEGGSQFIYFQF